MYTSNPPDEINGYRRRFFGGAAMTIAAAQLGVSAFGARGRLTSWQCFGLSAARGSSPWAVI